MQIKSITVGLGLTESLPDYNNVKPSLTMTAGLDPGEDEDAVISFLSEQVTDYCQATVDDALEHAGQSPKYYDGPLYKIAEWQQSKAIVILPADVNIDDLPGNWRLAYHVRPMRLASCSRWATRLAQGKEILEYNHASLHELFEWWDEQEWYISFGLLTWAGPYDWEIKHVLIARHGLQIIPDDEVRIIREDPHPLADLIEDAEKKGRAYTVIEDQETLDTTIATWLAEHPRESHSEEDIRF